MELYELKDCSYKPSKTTRKEELYKKVKDKYHKTKKSVTKVSEAN